MGGWETLEMVLRYAHLSADHLAHWVTPVTAEPTPILAAMSLSDEGRKPLRA
ncbi:site-specific recombinase, phage integrase family domain protein [Burkholderia cepacia]|nr:site-specific recombinase, phage integrase family domain protein [Burkholderia cepacia]